MSWFRRYYYFRLVAAILDFRDDVASARIAGDLDVSYIVINPCIVCGTTCVSVKPANLLVLPVIWLPYWISSTYRRPTKSEVSLLEGLTPKHPENIVAVGILSLCVLELNVCLEVILPAPSPCCRQTSQKNRCREKG